MNSSRHFFALGLICFAVLFAFGDVLSSTSILSFRDHMDVFRPTFQFVVEHLRDGSLPFGPMHSQAGTALETQLNGTYTPLTLILFLAPFDLAYDWYIAAHFLVLSLGTYGLARHLKASTPASAAIAILCSLTGPSLSTENLISAAHGLAFAPWVYWAMDRLLTAPTLRATALFAIALGFQVQGAIPVVLWMNILVGLVLLFHRRQKMRPILLAYGFLSLILAFGLAAIEIGGVLEYLPLSRRGQGFGYAEASRWSVSSGQLLEFFIPSMWWAPDKTYLLHTEVLGSQMPPYFISLYLGVCIPLGIGATLSRPGERLHWLFAMILVLLIAMGSMTPLHAWVMNLPLLSSSRFPVKYTLLLVPIFAYLLARVFQDIEKLNARYLACALLHLGACLCLLVVFGMDEIKALLAQSFSEDSIEALPIGATKLSYGQAFADAIRGRIWHTLIFSAFSTALIGFAVFRKNSTGPWLKWALCIVIVLDLSFAARLTIFGAPVEPKSPPSAIMDQLSSDEHLVFIATPRGRRAAFFPTAKETEFASSVRSANERGHNAHHRMRYLRDIDRNGLSPLASSLALETLKTSNFQQAVGIMQRSGTHWMGSYSKGLFKDALIHQIPQERAQYFYRIPQARGYVAHHFDWRYLELGQSASQADAQFIRTLPKEIAFVTKPIRTEVMATCTSSMAAQSSTISYRRSPASYTVEIESESPCPRLVSILETNMPNWKVYVDDEPAEIWTIDFGQIGTYLKPGKHKLKIRYEPSSLVWAQITGASWVLVLILLAAPRKKKSIFA